MQKEISALIAFAWMAAVLGLLIGNVMISRDIRTATDQLVRDCEVWGGS